MENRNLFDLAAEAADEDDLVDICLFLSEEATPPAQKEPKETAAAPGRVKEPAATEAILRCDQDALRAACERMSMDKWGRQSAHLVALANQMGCAACLATLRGMGAEAGALKVHVTVRAYHDGERRRRLCVKTARRSCGK